MDPGEFMREFVTQIKSVIQEETARGVAAVSAAAVSKAQQQQGTPTQHAQISNQFGHLRAPQVPSVVQVYRITPEGERVVTATTTAQLLAEACDILLDISDSLARERPKRRKRSV
jgi:hypothetical protein